jgi:hypothetical protein
MQPPASPRCAQGARRPTSATARRCAIRTTMRRGAGRHLSAKSSRPPVHNGAREWASPFRSDSVCTPFAAQPQRSRLPPYDEIAAWSPKSTARSAAQGERAYREMRARYDVVIDSRKRSPP